MKRRKYFNPRIETIRHQELRTLQEKKLRKQLEYTIRNSQFYKQKLKDAKVDARSIRTLNDLPRLPLTTKDEIRRSQELAPLGTYISAPLSNIRRIHGSSGTTGKSIYLGLTEHDIQVWAEGMARSYYACNLRPGDIFLSCWAYHLFVSGVSEQAAIEKTGAAVVPIGTGQSNRLLTIAKDLHANAIGATPSYILHLAELVKAKLGKEPSEFGFRKACLGAEVGLGIPSTRKRIEETWELDARDVYGMSDVLSCISGECDEKRGMHFAVGDYVIMELVDPKTGEPIEVADNTEAEPVFTTIEREASPVIRFRSGDILKVFTDKCPCGRTSVRIRCLGRVDDVIKVKGTALYPGTIEAVIRSFTELTGEYEIVVDRPEHLDTLTVRAEYISGQKDLQSLVEEITNRISSLTLITPKVELVKGGTLPRVEYKARRVHDLRNEAHYQNI